MNGINGSGEYTIYVNQGGAISFTSTLFNDNTSEVMLVTNNTSQFGGISHTFLPPSNSGGAMSF